MTSSTIVIEKWIIFISRLTIGLPIVLFAIATVSLITNFSIWLTGILVFCASVLICAGIATPGIFILFQLPKLAYIWIKARSLFYFSNTSWELLSNKQRRKVLFDSIFALFIVIIFIIWVITDYTAK